jgi:hypothetical protein
MHTVVWTLTGVIVLLFLWAGSVHATCGWVLWESNVGGRKAPTYTPEGKERVGTQSYWEAKSAFTTLDECHKEIEDTLTHITANTTEEVSRSRESGEVTLLVPLPPKEGVIPLQVYRFRCLPDPVKPQL